LVFKAAPIQVDLGALCGLGIPQIDYRITDDVLDPPDMQPYHLEKLVYLSGGFVTYCPPSESPLVTPLAAQSNGFVTLGSFNNHVKINDQVMGMWSEILRRVPNARLVLKFPRADDPGIRRGLQQRFQKHGIALDRIQFAGMTSYFDHLRLLGQMDLLLDCFPFNGYRTALEGLWMGVPTISLSGTTHVSRTGLAILKQLGLDEAFAAQTPQGYIDRACAYAAQLDELASIRSALRKLLLSSSICDPKRYARSLEEAFRTMWRQWCEQQNRVKEKAV
jgi:predicted O-linked N-acetylglucosamine transferase (SPINDLY family)